VNCTFCKKATPKQGYCCERAELETLRVVMDEAQQLLNSEVVAAQTIGTLDAHPVMSHVSEKLRDARIKRVA
jgi:hypothetical protein